MSCLVIVAVSSCGVKSANNSETESATESSYGMTEKPATKSASEYSDRTGKTEYDKSQWIFDGSGETQTYAMVSDNYYVIDGRKIALLYLFGFTPNSPISDMKYSVGFSFFDITDDGASNLPIFDKVNNKELSIIWNNDVAGRLAMLRLEPTNIITTGPHSYNFQKTLNNAKRFKVSVATTSGQSLQYDFDISQRDGLSI